MDPDANPAAARPDAPRILLVEDVASDAELVEHALAHAGIDGPRRRVQTEAELLAALREFRPDVILSDHSLPSFTARDTLRVALHHAPGIPVIIVTGSLDEETAADYIKDGAADYVVKHHLERLASAVRRALALKRAREERTQTESELRQSEERYRTLVEGVRDVIFALTPDGTIASLNPAFEDITGWPPAEWLGRPFEGLLHTDDLRLALDLIDRVLRGEPRPISQLRIATRRGEYRIAEIGATAQLRDGNVVGILGICRDVTERLSLEQQLRHAQKMEAVGRLAGGVAHDFNNVLTAITGYAELLLRDLAPQDPRADDVGEIRKAADRATALTRQLLAFSRQQVLQPRIVDLNDLVSDTKAMLSRLLGEDVNCTTKLAGGLGTVRADPDQIGQVLMNLAVNSRDAMPDGGTLTIETANADPDETPAQAAYPAAAGRYVMFAVRDSGVGMSAEVQAHLFEPFFTTKEQGKGTGLGLATVYGIVQQSGGFILVESEIGRGTTFRIYLPRVDGAPEPVATPPMTVALGTETVLLAEDDRAVGAVARQALERYGYTVLQAQRPEIALDVAARHAGPIDLLLSDVVMPGMKGPELAERLRAIRPAVKVLYMSGYAADVIARRGMLDPGVAYLQKPFTPELLASKVREVLDR